MIPLTFTISPGCIRIQVPGTDYDEDIPNVVAYDLESRLPVALGISRDAMAKDNPDYLQAMQDSIGFASVFTPDIPPDQLETTVLDYYQAVASDQRGPRGLNLAPLLNGYDFTFWIQGYDSWSLERRQQFEFELLARHRADRLRINGQSRVIPRGQRRLEFWLRLLLMYGAPIASMAWVLTWIAGSDHPAILIPALFIVPVLVAILGIAVWMLGMRALLPAGYLKVVARPRNFFRGIWDWLAKRLLPEE